MKHQIKKFILSKMQALGWELRKMEEHIIDDKKYVVRKGTIKDPPPLDHDWLKQLTKSSKMVLDLGANIGQSAMVILSNDSVEKLVMVDPNPRALSIAAENVILNNLAPKCMFVNSFISDELNKEIDFYTISYAAAGSRFKSMATSASSSNTFFKVKTSTVDSLCEEFSLKPDLIKVDVEGAEMEVLYGAKATAKCFKPIFFIEMHSSIEIPMIDNTENLIKWCSENDYTPYYLPKGEILNMEKVSRRGRYHVFLKHKDAQAPKELKS